nr:disks large 1 [Hymenolepis microstoma]
MSKVSFSKEALILLKKLDDKLTDGVEKSLKNSMNRLIAALESDLFNSLIGRCYIHKIIYLPLISKCHLKMLTNLVKSIIAWNFQQQTLLFATVLFLLGMQATGNIIAGGYDAPQDNGDSSVFVTRIAPGGIAEADGRLQPFDRIVSVNGTDLNYVSNQEAVRILKESGDTLAMIIRRYIGHEPVSSGIESVSPITNTNMPPSNDDQTASEDVYFEVNLVKPSENVGLGFTIAGGQMIDGFPEGIYVTKLTPGGLAEQDGQIQPGDRLIQVNGQELGNASHELAVQLLRNAGIHVHLVLLRPVKSTVSQNFTPSLASDDTIVDTKKH